MVSAELLAQSRRASTDLSGPSDVAIHMSGCGKFESCLMCNSNGTSYPGALRSSISPPTFRAPFYRAKDLFLRFGELLFEAVDPFFEQLYIFLRRRLEI